MFSNGQRVPVRFDGTSVPVRSAYTSLLSARPFLRLPFPGGSAHHSPAGGPSVLRSPDSEFHAPNNALQRTAGWRPALILAFPPAVAELGSVRRSSSLLCSWRHVGSHSLRGQRLLPFASSSRFAFWFVASFVQPFQPAAPVIPPAGWTLVPVPLHSEFHAPNNALQRTEAGGGVYSVVESCVASLRR